MASTYIARNLLSCALPLVGNYNKEMKGLKMEIDQRHKYTSPDRWPKIKTKTPQYHKTTIWDQI